MQIRTNLRTTTTPTSADSLRARLEKLTACQERMQRVNSYVRNRNVRALKEMGYTDAGIATLFSRSKPHLGGGFFPTYKVTNNATIIRMLRAQLADMEANADAAPALVEGKEYTSRSDGLSVSFTFLAKPDKGARALLRRNGFVRSSGEFTYSREWSAAALRAAAHLRGIFDA